MKYLFTFLLFNTICFAQENKTETMLIYPKCEKLVKKGNESLQNCFLEKLVNELAESATYILSRDKILYADLKVEIRFIVDEKGKFISLEYFGSPENQRITKEAFERYLTSLEKKKKTIIPTKDENGEFIAKSFRIPFQFKYNKQYINSLN
ncbi:hypothetical protein ACTS9U_17085 [Empedobacter falsenii]|uniref:TonB C-terminal domain-containing protein n=1 Tax=Empedobacter falsenii TaxID=343874 RepID=A0A376GFR0_9FLAO|nr:MULTISPECIES: hypothetical protein [Empedobacter]MDM1042837.1 hypothetical protein [Empedobacter brevis]MDM1136767.1 hypothetical protein [Empedobacter sp. R750]STD59234.1 Uncharacterised protein [Empedobacter falsenii]